MTKRIKGFGIIICLTLLSLLSVQSKIEIASPAEVKIDTTAIVLRTDSLAAALLETYDQNSQRGTGVPLSVPHYDKTVVFDSLQNAVVVTYQFSKEKFYGPKNDNIALTGQDKFPFHVVIIFEMSIGRVRQFEAG